jgi:sulfatase maturation enzyme AslB (radical SAM superfamily)
MDTYCARSWNYFLVDLDKLEQKMCCKTKWKPMDPGVDWFNGPAMVQRRQYHLSGKQHSDCEHCWDLENQNQWSPRIGAARPDTIPDTLQSWSHGMLELTVGNTCDLACRYCDSRYSTIWAARTQDKSNNKEGRASYKGETRTQLAIDQFYAWLDTEKDKLSDVLITGGEPLLIPETYELLRRTRFQNVKIQFNTNLNTPDHYLNQIEEAIDRLLDDGNKVLFRVSVDGVGQKNDWQRQNCNWDRWRDNWFRIGSRPVHMKAALTLTPLTLEGMHELAEFVLDSGPKLHYEPTFEVVNVVTWPRPLNVTEWIPAFKHEIAEFGRIVEQQHDYGQKEPIKRQISTWLSLEDALPSAKQVRSFTDFLDGSQARWGGGDWRSIYPKTAEIAQRVLDQNQS